MADAPQPNPPAPKACKSRVAFHFHGDKTARSYDCAYEEGHECLAHQTYAKDGTEIMWHLADQSGKNTKCSSVLFLLNKSISLDYEGYCGLPRGHTGDHVAEREELRDNLSIHTRSDEEIAVWLIADMT